MHEIGKKANSLAFSQNPDGTLSVVGLLHRHLPQVVIPDVFEGRAVTRIGEWAFAMSDDLTDIALPKTLHSIGDRAFAACKRLRCVTFPDSLRMIGDRAFFDCPELDVVSIPSSVRTIGDGAFALCGLNSIHVSHENKHYLAIDGCQALEEVTILPGTSTIKGEAFMRCECLTTVRLPDTLTCIDCAAFRFCGKLEQVVIPMSVNYIGKMAFADCPALAQVHFADPDGWTVNGERVDVSYPMRAAKMLSGKSATAVWRKIDG